MGGRKIYSFFFSRENFVSKKQSKEKIIYSRTIAREKEKVSVSIYFPCFSTLRFFVGGHGGRKRLFTPTLSRLRNAAAVINYPGKSCNDPDIPSISQGGRGSSAIRPIGVSWENRVIDKPRQPRPTFRLRRSSVLLEFSMLAFLVAHRKNLRWESEKERRVDVTDTTADTYTDRISRRERYIEVHKVRRAWRTEKGRR